MLAKMYFIFFGLLFLFTFCEQKIFGDVPKEFYKFTTIEEEKAPENGCYFVPCPFYLTARHIEAGGIGYSHGYTTIEGMFFPTRQKTANWFPIIDLRTHFFNDGQVAANAGLGFRYRFDKSEIIFGGNVFYDYRHSSRHFDYNQIGAGIELLSCKWGFRINGYLPFKHEKTYCLCRFTNNTNDYFISKRKIEASFVGVSTELGRFLVLKPIRAFLAVGAYFYGKDVCCHPVGGKLRLKFDIGRYLSLEGKVSYDNVFHTRVQGQLALKYPFGSSCDNDRLGILSQPIQRHEIIVLDDYCRWKWNY